MKIPELKFYVKSGKYLYVQCYIQSLPVILSLGITISKSEWDNGDVPKWIKKRIAQLTKEFDDYCKEQRDLTRPIDKDYILAMFAKHAGRELAAKQGTTILELFTRYYNDMASGAITNNGKKYSKASVIMNSFVKRKLELHTSFSSIDISALTAKHLETFKSLLIADKLTQNTISAYTNQFGFFLSRTRSYKWHNNALAAEKGLSVKAEKVDYHIALTVAEIAAICDLTPIDEETEQAQDIIAFGCGTGLRHSDLSDSIEFKGMKDGILTVLTKKTGKKVEIPISAKVKKIWDKYNGNIPNIPNHRLTIVFRRLAKQASETEPTLKTDVLKVRTKGGERKKEYVKRWELVSCHTTRRTFATNAYLSGLPVESIMKITGHSNSETLLRYIRLDGTQHAKLMQANDFFK